MAIRTLIAWDSNDLPSTWNDRMRDIFNVGVYHGGEVTLSATPLHVIVAPFVAVSFDGMVVRDDDESHEVPDSTHTLQDNQVQLICLMAKYRLFDPPLLEWRVILESAYPVQPDKDYLIVFARATVVAGVVTLEPYGPHRIDPVRHQTMRLPVATTADLPLLGNVEGDMTPVIADRTLWIWTGGAWQPHEASVDAFAAIVTATMSSYAEGLRYGNGTGVLAGGPTYEEKVGDKPGSKGSISDYRTEIYADTTASSLDTEGFSVLLNGHFLKTRPYSIGFQHDPGKGPQATATYIAYLEFKRSQLSTLPSTTELYFERFLNRGFPVPAGVPVPSSLADLLPLAEKMDQNTELEFDFFPLEVRGANMWIRSEWRIKIAEVDQVIAGPLTPVNMPNHLHEYLRQLLATPNAIMAWDTTVPYRLETGGGGPNQFYHENLYVAQSLPSGTAVDDVAYMIPLFVFVNDGTGAHNASTTQPWAMGGTAPVLWPVYPRCRDNLQQMELDGAWQDHLRMLNENRAQRCSGFVEFAGYRWQGGPNNTVSLVRGTADDLPPVPPIEFGPQSPRMAVQIDGALFRFPFHDVLHNPVMQLPAPPSGIQGAARRDLVYLTMRRVLQPTQQSSTSLGAFVDTGLPVPYYEKVNGFDKRTTTQTLKYEFRVEVASVDQGFDEFSAFYQYAGENPMLDVDGRPLARTLNGVNYHRHANDPGLWVGVEDPARYNGDHPVFQHAINGTNEDEPTETALTGPFDSSLMVDGLVYAIPLALVHRRNLGIFDACSNANGTTFVPGQLMSLRPDGATDATLVMEREILDLRHLVEVCSTDLESLLYRSLDLNAQGRLFTSFGHDEAGGVILRDRLGAEILRTEELGVNPCEAGMTEPDGKRLLWSDSYEGYTRPLHQCLDAVILGEGFNIGTAILPGLLPGNNTYMYLTASNLDGRRLIEKLPKTDLPPGPWPTNYFTLPLVRASVCYLKEDGLPIPPQYVAAYGANIHTRRVVVANTQELSAYPRLDGGEPRFTPPGVTTYELLSEEFWRRGLRTFWNTLAPWLGYTAGNVDADFNTLSNWDGTELFLALHEEYVGHTINHGLKYEPTKALLGYREDTDPVVNEYVWPDIPQLHFRLQPTQETVSQGFYRWNGTIWTAIVVPEAIAFPGAPSPGDAVFITVPGPDYGYWVWDGAAWQVIAAMPELPPIGAWVGVVVNLTIAGVSPDERVWSFTINRSDMIDAVAAHLFGSKDADISALGTLQFDSCCFPVEVNDGDTPMRMLGYEFVGGTKMKVYIRSLQDSTFVTEPTPYGTSNLGWPGYPLPAVNSSKFYNVVVAFRFGPNGGVGGVSTGYCLGKANKSVKALYEWRTEYIYNGQQAWKDIAPVVGAACEKFNTAVVARDGVILKAYVYRLPTASEELGGSYKTEFITDYRTSPSGYMATNFVPFCLLWKPHVGGRILDPDGDPDHMVYVVHYLVHRPIKTCEKVYVNYLYAPYQGIVRDNQDAMLKLQGKALRVSDVFTTGYGAYAPWLHLIRHRNEIKDSWEYFGLDIDRIRAIYGYERHWDPSMRHDPQHTYANVVHYLPFPHLNSFGLMVKGANCGDLLGWSVDEGDIKPPVFHSPLMAPGLVRRHRRNDLQTAIQVEHQWFMGGPLAQIIGANEMLLLQLGPHVLSALLGYARNAAPTTTAIATGTPRLAGYGGAATDPLQAFHTLTMPDLWKTDFSNDVTAGRRGWVVAENYASYQLILAGTNICQIRYPSANVFLGPDADYWNRIGNGQFPGQFGVAWSGIDYDVPTFGLGIGVDADSGLAEFSFTESPQTSMMQPGFFPDADMLLPNYKELRKNSLYNYLGMMLQHPSGDLLMQITCGWTCNPVFSPVGGIYDGFWPIFRPLVREGQLDRNRSAYNFLPWIPQATNLPYLANTGDYCGALPPGHDQPSDLTFTICILNLTWVGVPPGPYSLTDADGAWGGTIAPTALPRVLIGVWSSQAAYMLDPRHPDVWPTQLAETWLGAGAATDITAISSIPGAQGTYHFAVTSILLAGAASKLGVVVLTPDGTAISLPLITFDQAFPLNPVIIDNGGGAIDAGLTSITTTVGAILGWVPDYPIFNVYLSTPMVTDPVDVGGTWTTPTPPLPTIVSGNYVVAWLVPNAWPNASLDQRLAIPAEYTINIP